MWGQGRRDPAEDSWVLGLGNTWAGRGTGRSQRKKRRSRFGHTELWERSGNVCNRNRLKVTRFQVRHWAGDGD
jgi:hypothetical protein